MKKAILIVGGARSGKSRFAQELARKLGGQVLFVATAEAGDKEMSERIEEHQKERPATWRTLEASSHVGRRIKQEIGKAQVVAVDCVTLLVSNIFSQYNDQTLEGVKESVLEKQVVAEINELVECMKSIDASFVIVSNELGSGIVPNSRVGRIYRDLLGKANQMLAQSADEVYLMVAGLPVKIKP
jgi:adenosylcobinamide kinase/adenosylcobinamide-phosphate guanylyltransferase